MSAPVAYRVKDFGDGWILCHTLEQAEREAKGCGNLIEPLHREGPPEPVGEEFLEFKEALSDLRSLRHEGCAMSDLDVILEWYRGLGAGARQKLSLADLHGLSKRLTAARVSPSAIAHEEGAICGCDPGTEDGCGSPHCPRRIEVQLATIERAEAGR